MVERTGPPWTCVNDKLKHESQCFVRSAVLPSRLVVSTTSVQKHVGHTFVQLAHAKQRDATSSQRGCSRFSFSRSGKPCVSRRRPIDASVLADMAAASSTSSALAGLFSMESRRVCPLGDRISTKNRCSPLSMNSVSARSYPPLARGPVFIDAQKQVPPARMQLTATTKTSSRLFA